MKPANDPWVWIDPSVIHAVHDEQLGEHGGSAGLRDAGLLESALARPLQLAAYDEPDAASLAAAYGFGLAKNHSFIDGNKRTAFVAVELFLALNGWSLVANDADCVMAMLRLAAGDMSEGQFADWVRANSSKG
ncbi:MAG: type II toxin-antitoxin system death-on-curing family toxin [Pseudomonadota bacterium]